MLGAEVWPIGFIFVSDEFSSVFYLYVLIYIHQPIKSFYTVNET